MTDDEKVEIYNKGVQEGIKHKKPSQLTMQFMEETKSDIGVVIERISGIKEVMEREFSGVHRRFDENQEAHKDMIARQDYTNGNVRRLQLWRAGIVGSLAVVVFIASYAIRDYLDFKKAQQETLLANTLMIEKIKSVDNRLTFIESLIEKE